MKIGPVNIGKHQHSGSEITRRMKYQAAAETSQKHLKNCLNVLKKMLSPHRNVSLDSFLLKSSPRKSRKDREWKEYFENKSRCNTPNRQSSRKAG